MAHEGQPPLDENTALTKEAEDLLLHQMIEAWTGDPFGHHPMDLTIRNQPLSHGQEPETDQT